MLSWNVLCMCEVNYILVLWVHRALKVAWLGFFKIQPCPLPHVWFTSLVFLGNFWIIFTFQFQFCCPCPDLSGTPVDFWMIMCFVKRLLHCQAFEYVLNGLALFILPQGSWGSWTVMNCWWQWLAKVSAFQPSLPRLGDILCSECQFEVS